MNSSLNRVLTSSEIRSFAHHRFRHINDDLTEAFIYLVDQYEKQAKAAAEMTKD